MHEPVKDCIRDSLLSNNIIPITEPALGYGMVGAGVYFIPKKKTSKNEFKIPDIVGLGGGFECGKGGCGGGALTYTNTIQGDFTGGIILRLGG